MVPPVMDSKTIHEVTRRCPGAHLRCYESSLYVVARQSITLDEIGVASTSMDEAWDNALMALRERDVRQGKFLASVYSQAAIEEFNKNIQAKRTTIDDAALKLKEAIQAAMQEFVNSHVAVDYV